MGPGNSQPLERAISYASSCELRSRNAIMGKHVAATLYGPGPRLDQQPELLFIVRGVDYEELMETAIEIDTAIAAYGRTWTKRPEADEPVDLFGIEVHLQAPATSSPASESRPDKVAVPKTSTTGNHRKAATANSRAKKTKSKRATAAKSNKKRKSAIRADPEATDRGRARKACGNNSAKRAAKEAR